MTKREKAEAEIIARITDQPPSTETIRVVKRIASGILESESVKQYFAEMLREKCPECYDYMAGKDGKVWTCPSTQCTHCKGSGYKENP